MRLGRALELICKIRLSLSFWSKKLSAEALLNLWLVARNEWLMARLVVFDLGSKNKHAGMPKRQNTTPGRSSSPFFVCYSSLIDLCIEI